MVVIYAIVAIIIRLILSMLLFQKGKKALSSRTRTMVTMLNLAYAISLFFGFYVYLFTLILLIQLGFRIYQNKQFKKRQGLDPIVFALTMVIFIKGPGIISIDHLLGHV